jgi:hypothetical protein
VEEAGDHFDGRLLANGSSSHSTSEPRPGGVGRGKGSDAIEIVERRFSFRPSILAFTVVAGDVEGRLVEVP